MKLVQEKYIQTEIGLIPSDWKVMKLGNMTKLMTNGFVGVAKTHYTENRDGVLYIQGYNVEENSFKFRGIKKVTLDFHLKNSKSCLKKDDLLTVQTGDVGLTTIIPKHLEGSNCHALIITRFKKNRYNALFFCYYLNSKTGRGRLKEIETGTTMKHINVGELVHFEVPVPTLEEQTAIATALSNTDSWITNLENLLTKKRQIKQGALQELLKLKEGWEAKSLGECLKIKHGKDQKSVEDKNGKYPILGTGGLMNYTNSYLYDKPSVLIGRKGTIDKPQFMNTPFWTVDTLFYSEVSKNYSPKFLYYNFLLIDWYSYNEASGVPSLNAKTIEKILIPVPPTLEEQVRIVTILSDMDIEIEQLETKLEKAKKVKQGMMQELLTGKTRLV